MVGWSFPIPSYSFSIRRELFDGKFLAIRLSCWMSMFVVLWPKKKKKLNFLDKENFDFLSRNAGFLMPLET